jgi:hypothetical protein
MSWVRNGSDLKPKRESILSSILRWYRLQYWNFAGFGESREWISHLIKPELKINLAPVAVLHPRNPRLSKDVSELPELPSVL